MLGLIEGPRNEEHTLEIMEGLNKEFLRNELINCYKKFITDHVHFYPYIISQHNDLLEEILRNFPVFPVSLTKPFTIYLLLKHLSFSNPSLLKHETAKEAEAFNFYNRYTTSIEIIFRGSLLRVAFQKQPYQRYLTNVRHNIMSVGLASSEDKIRVSR